MEFTRDTSKLLAVIYKQYLEQRKNGASRAEAKSFQADFYKEAKSLSDWQDSDISDSIRELQKANFIKKDILGNFTIQDALIIKMETRFQSGLTDVTKYLADLAAGIATGLFL